MVVVGCGPAVGGFGLVVAGGWGLTVVCDSG